MLFIFEVGEELNNKSLIIPRYIFAFLKEFTFKIFDLQYFCILLPGKEEKRKTLILNSYIYIYIY